MAGQAIGAKGQAARCRFPDTPRASIHRDIEAPLEEASMLDRLIRRFRIWHFTHTCRHDPERIGFEVRRMLVELRGPARWAYMRELMLSESASSYPRALGVVAASRWKITDSAEVARVFESLTADQRERVYAAVDYILPRHRG